MYAVSKDIVVEIDDVPLPDPGAPCPQLYASDSSAQIAYYVAEADPRWKATYAKLWSDSDELVIEECVAIVDCVNVYAHFFGPPNDEAFEGHPLASRGLTPYGVFEVRNSSWIRALERMNSVHMAHNPKQFDTYRHFIISYHDSTFECVAHSLSFEILNGFVEELLIKKLEGQIDLRNR